MRPAIEFRSRARLRSAIWGVLGAVLLVLGCQSAGDSPTGGETHFLRGCEPGGEPCGGGLVCVCNVCTLECALSNACASFPGAECLSQSTSNSCGEASSGNGYCEFRCASDRECEPLSAEHRCQGGVCRAGVSSSGGEGGSAGGSSGAAGSGGSEACAPSEIAGNQVLLIGDSFFAGTHAITAELEGLARSAGALAANERYRDASTLFGNALALGGNGIANQYTSAVAESEVEVVVMTGGGADLLVGSCEPPLPECPLIVDAGDAARELLARMSDDGVGHVVYAFYPDPSEAGLRAEMDVLRPVIEQACAQSPVPCHWVDLRVSFAGHYDEYILPDGMNPTPAGSRAAAEAIWAVMQSQCIAQ